MSPFDGGDQLGRALVADLDGALNRTLANIQKLGCIGLRGLANWRMLIVAALHCRQLRRDHRPLAFVQVPAAFTIA